MFCWYHTTNPLKAIFSGISVRVWTVASSVFEKFLWAFCNKLKQIVWYVVSDILKTFSFKSSINTTACRNERISGTVSQFIASRIIAPGVSINSWQGGSDIRCQHLTPPFPDTWRLRSLTTCCQIATLKGLFVVESWRRQENLFWQCQIIV